MSGSTKAKIFWGILITIAVVWIGGVLWLDSAIAASIRLVGSALTGTKVNVTSVSLKVFTGKLKINGFTIDNPDGFRSERMLSVGNFFVDLDMGTLFSKKLVIEHLELGKLHMDYEPSLSGKSNLQVILDNVTGEERDAANRRKTSEADKGTQRKVVIKKLIVRDTALSVSSSALRSTVKLNLPTIEMNNVGGGRSVGEAVEEFFTRLLREITNVFDFNKFSDQLKETGEQILNKLDKATDSVGGAVVSAGDSAGNAVNDALQRSKNLVRGAMPGMGK